MPAPKLLYVSFDIVPAPKGAAVHIEQFTRILSRLFDPLHLVTVSKEPTGAEHSVSPGVIQTTLPAPGDNLLMRVMHFRRFLQSWISNRRFDVVHFRSPFEGFPIAINKAKYCRFLVFEVNGLPSIELKYRYPLVAEDTVLMNKLIGQEQICLQAADLVITPSAITAKYLVDREVSISKIVVVPNGVSLSNFTYSSPLASIENNTLRLLYFGTLAPWQGIEQAIRAIASPSSPDCHLTVCGAGSPSQLRRLSHLATALGVADRLALRPTVDQSELRTLMHNSHALLVPLTANDRNLVQGCCPLKLLESMASGTPVIASDLPVVREIAGTDECLLFTKPGSPREIAEQLWRVSNESERMTKLSLAARHRIESEFTWAKAEERLLQAYTEMMDRPGR